MTEHEGPRDGSHAAATSPQGSSVDGAASAKADAAKDQAAGVASEAAGDAQHVAETARSEAAGVATEATANARDLLNQARSDLTDQAGAQQQKVAEGLRSVAGELQSMADNSEQPGVAADLVRQAAQRSSSAASWLDNRSPGSLVDEVKTFARRRPLAFLAIAAGAGFLAGRLNKSLSAGLPQTAQAESGTQAGMHPAAGAPPAGSVTPPETIYPPEPQVQPTYAAGVGNVNAGGAVGEPPSGGRH